LIIELLTKLVESIPLIQQRKDLRDQDAIITPIKQALSAKLKELNITKQEEAQGYINWFIAYHYPDYHVVSSQYTHQWEVKIERKPIPVKYVYTLPPPGKYDTNPSYNVRTYGDFVERSIKSLDPRDFKFVCNKLSNYMRKVYKQQHCTSWDDKKLWQFKNIEKAREFARKNFHPDDLYTLFENKETGHGFVFTYTLMDFD
jgi:hypothetical protein